MRTSLDRQQRQLFEMEGNRRLAGQAAALLSVNKRWFWLFGLVAVASLAGVVFHERRHEVRRLLNGGRARAMGLSKFLSAAAVILALLAGVTFYFGDRIYESLLTVGTGRKTSPRETIRRQNADLAAQIAPLERKHDDLQRKYEAALAAAPAADRRRPARPQHAAGRLDQDPPARGRVQRDACAVEPGAPGDAGRPGRAGQARQGAGRADGGHGHLPAVAAVRFAAASAWRWWRWRFRAGGPFRGVRARREVAATPAPCASARTTWSRGRYGGRAGARRRGHRAVQQRDQPAALRAVQLRVRRRYRSMKKLCFPTLGVPQAGKTHWLSMLYWELNRGNYPKSVQFEKAKLATSEDFDVLVEEILNSRIGTAATQRERIPRPLVFNFRDRDALEPQQPAGEHFRLLRRSHRRHGRRRLSPAAGPGGRRFLLLPRSHLSHRAAGQGPGRFPRGHAAGERGQEPAASSGPPWRCA